MKFLLFALLLSCSQLRAAVSEPLAAIVAVTREGQGNEAASAAWQEIVKTGPSALPAVIAATGSGSAVADNWLRIAGSAIVEGAQTAHQPLPLAELQAFLRDRTHRGAGRRLAFDLLQQADPAQADALEPTLIDDPVQELRRGAVQRLIHAAKKTKGDAAKVIYRQALDAVRDEDQTKIVATELRQLGEPVDLPRHFGFLMSWQIVGPFENTAHAGFDTVFPPENNVQLDATYEGKSGPVKWQPFVSTDEYGKIDLNKPLGLLKEVTGYAVTSFEVPEARDAELRLGCKNAWKVWLNGELLFGRDEYHRGQQMDQYKLKCRLQPGRNTVLVKCCQNEQTEQWTVEWEFQIRLCDATGTAILPKASATK